MIIMKTCLFILVMVGILVILFYIMSTVQGLKEKVAELETKSIYYEKAYEQMREQRNKFIKRNCELQIKNNEAVDPNTNL